MNRFPSLTVYAAMLLVLTMPLPARAQSRPAGSRIVVAYHNDFSRQAGKEWSQPAVARSPNDSASLLGPFGGETVSLSLTGLGKHAMVRLSVDVYAIGSWDGSAKTYGPDVWQIAVHGGPVLLRTTFGHKDHSREGQAFPGEYPEDQSPPMSGAMAVNSLGYLWQDRPTDATYPMTLTFPHSGETLRLDFSAVLNTLGKEDESWGLGSVRVELLDRPEPVSQARLARLWELLGDEDAGTSFWAMWALVGAGPEAAKFLDGQLAGKLPPAREVRALIAQLDHAEWSKREEASKALAGYGAAVKPELLEAAGIASIEVRSRAEELLRTVNQKAPAGESRRLGRAARALRLIRWQEPPLPATVPATAPADTP